MEAHLHINTNRQTIKGIVKKSILVTMHRRESINSKLEKFIHNLKAFLKNNPEFHVNWPLHSNPNILMKIEKSFKKNTNQVKFSKPLGAKLPSINIKLGLIISLSIALFIESNDACKIFRFKISSTEAEPIA